MIGFWFEKSGLWPRCLPFVVHIKRSKSSCNARYLALSWSYIGFSYIIGRRIDSSSLSYILFASNFLTIKNKHLTKIDIIYFHEAM
jgi:hypothetical protein